MVTWQHACIGDACRLVNGGTPKTKIAEYWSGRHAWITPAEMGGRESPYVNVTRRTLSEEGLAKCSASLLPPLSVILSSRAPIGHLVINDVPMATNQGCKGLIPGDELHHKFLYYYLYSIVDLLSDLGTGTTFKELSATRLKGVRVPLPPLSEQERIVAILDEAFAAIVTATAKAERSLANARRLFESQLNVLFSRRDASWSACPLGDLLERITYGFTNPMPTTDEGPYLVTAKNINVSRILYEHARHTSQEAFDTLLTDKSRPRVGDVLLTKDGTLGRLAVVDRDNICINQSVALLRPNERVDPQFLKYLLSSPHYQRRMAEDAGGTTIKHIYITRVDKMEVAFPPLAEQRHLVEAIDVYLAKTRNLERACQQRVACLTELKQSILHKAFTGELTADPNTTDRTLSEAGV